MSDDPRLPSASDFAPGTGFYIKEWDVPLVQVPDGAWFNWYGGKPAPFEVKFLRVDNNSRADSFEQWLEIVAASLKPPA